MNFLGPRDRAKVPGTELDDANARPGGGKPFLRPRVHQVGARMLRRHKLSQPDPDEDLRLNGVASPASVRSATLERNGEVSVVKQ
ncbi:MAG: hypothetical protein Q7S40_02775 [Opitutaceae bacterium]|nr:hypothetical protein [Opitutaceae bacterium]